MAQRSPTPVYLTVEEFEEYDVPDGMTAELVRGELVLSPGPGTRHGVIQLRLGARLLAFVDAHGLGTVLTAGGFELLDLPRTVRVPDLAFVPASRLSMDDIPVGFAQVTPDLVVEILSPSETKRRLQSKLDDYRTVAIPLVWLVDPRRLTITVIEKGESWPPLGKEDILSGGSVLPGFTLRVSEIYDEHWM